MARFSTVKGGHAGKSVRIDGLEELAKTIQRYETQRPALQWPPG